MEAFNREAEMELFNDYWTEKVLPTLDDGEADDSFAYDTACEAWMARAEMAAKASG